MVQGPAQRPAHRLALGLAVVGLLASAYLTYEHYSASTSFACPETGTINCVKVTTSAYSTLLGVPVALLGLLFYVAMVALLLPLTALATRTVARLRLVLVTPGVVFVLYLVWAELFRVDAICLWCTAVHVVTVALLGVLAYDAV